MFLISSRFEGLKDCLHWRVSVLHALRTQYTRIGCEKLQTGLYSFVILQAIVIRTRLRVDQPVHVGRPTYVSNFSDFTKIQCTGTFVEDKACPWSCDKVELSGLQANKARQDQSRTKNWFCQQRLLIKQPVLSHASPVWIVAGCLISSRKLLLIR